MKTKVPQRTSWRELLGLMMTIALPVAMQNLLSTTGSMVDTIMLGRLGETTVGAVGLCAQFSSLLFSGYWGFIGGGTLFFAQFWGAGNDDGIRKSYGIMLAFVSITAVAGTYLALCQPMWVMRLYTNSETIQRIGAEYLRVVGISYPLQLLAVAMASLLRSVERVRIPLAGAIAAVITNCVCNYILIFGKLGFPALGVRGAACGTILSSVVNVLVIVITAKIRKAPYLLDISGHWKWDAALLKEFLKKSFPIIMNEVLIGVGNMLINIVLGHQAEEAIAATAVFRTLEGLVIGFFAGFSSAATVLVGKEVGAGNHEEAFSRGWRLVYSCQFIILCVCLTVCALHSPILHAMGLSGKSYELATRMFLIYTVMGTIRMGNWVQNDMYRSAGDSAFGTILEICFMFLLVQPVIHLANGPLGLPFLAVFALCYVDEPVRYIIMQIHLYSMKWIKPVSDAGKRTIGAFREKYGIRSRG